MKQLAWDLSEFYQNPQDIDDDLVMLKRLGDNIIKTKNSLNTKEGVLNYFKLIEKFTRLQDKIESYLCLTKSLDGSSIFAIEKSSEIETYLENFSNSTTFVMQELKKVPSAELKKWSKLPEFSSYDNELLDIIKIKRHILSEKEEKIMIGAEYTNSQYEIFSCLDNVELKFGKIKDENGKTVELTNANCGKYLKSWVKSVRKSAIKNITNAYKAVNQTLSTNYLSYVKSKSFYAKTFKYKNNLEMCLENCDLPSGLPQNVVKNVTKHLDSLYRYFAWRKKFMKLPKFESCDLACNLFDKSVSKEYSLQQGISLLKKALSPLGKDYTDMLDYAIEYNWIDSAERPNKDSGAFNADVYDYHPFILLTYDNTLRSVNTLAHEFGHAMNGYYAQHAQPFPKFFNGIFLAEVASTVNEVLFSYYNIKNAKTKEEKIIHITDFLNEFRAAVFGQSQYTEFELYVHECVDVGEPLSYKKLNDYYGLLLKKYIGKSVSILEDSKYDWSKIPHFYMNFYVFKYVTGFISACAIAEKLVSDPNYKDVYKKFLSLGSSKKPCEALAMAGVDILSEDTYNSAFKLFDSYVDELQNLI